MSILTTFHKGLKAKPSRLEPNTKLAVNKGRAYIFQVFIVFQRVNVFFLFVLLWAFSRILDQII